MINAAFPKAKIKAYDEALTQLQKTAESVWAEGSCDALEKQFIALKALGIELATSGHVEALSALGRTQGTFRNIIELDTPMKAKDEIIQAMMAHFTLNDDLYSRLENGEVSPEALLALHLQLTAQEPYDSDVTTRLTNMHTSTFMDAFIGTFAIRASVGVDPVEFIKTLQCLTNHIRSSKEITANIDLIGAHLEQLRPGFEQLLSLPLAYKTQVLLAVSMNAEFWVGLYETTQDPLVKALCILAFRRPVGPRAWANYERMGLAHSPQWHRNAQTQARGQSLLSLQEYAIMTEGVDLDTAERPDEQISTGMFKSYVWMLEQVPLTSPGARKKAQSLVNKLVAHYINNPDDRLLNALVNSTIDPCFFARHYQILGSKFAADLGM